MIVSRGQEKDKQSAEVETVYSFFFFIHSLIHSSIRFVCSYLERLVSSERGGVGIVGVRHHSCSSRALHAGGTCTPCAQFLIVSDRIL